MIVKGTPVGQLGTNCYFFGDEETKTCAIVDPGDEAKKLAQMIVQSGMKLEAIFITHGHYDHCFAINELQEFYPEAKVYVHQSEVNLAEIPNNYMQMPKANHMHFVKEGSRVSVGKLEVQVLNTPGHSKGSLCLLVENHLFAGDTLFQGSCGRTDFQGGSMDEMLQSLKRLHDLEGDFQVYPGHEGYTTLARERESNSYMRQAVQNAQ